jgi:hypothetical protein
MSEYIDREAAISAIRGELEKENLSNAASHYARQGMGTAISVVSKLPAADVAPVVHAYWTDGNSTKRYDPKTDIYPYCSNCRKPSAYDCGGGHVATPGCPWCHAVMDLQEADHA